MKMKSPFNPSRLRCRWLPALAVTAVLGGVTAAPASAVHTTAPAAQVTAIMLYMSQLDAECQRDAGVPCPVNSQSAGWAPPPLPFGVRSDPDFEWYVRAM